MAMPSILALFSTPILALFSTPILALCFPTHVANVEYGAYDIHDGGRPLSNLPLFFLRLTFWEVALL